MITASRKNEIKMAAIDVLKRAEIHQLPVDLNLIFKAYGWGKLKFKEANEKGIQLKNVPDGYTSAVQDKDAWHYLILYDSTLSPQRIRWTIAHEIGHIALNHFVNGDAFSFNANEEAQYFAEQLLAPAAVVARMGGTTAAEIHKICNISMDAAQWRESDIQRHFWYHNKYGYTKYDKVFLTQFSISF